MAIQLKKPIPIGGSAAGVEIRSVHRMHTTEAPKDDKDDGKRLRVECTYRYLNADGTPFDNQLRPFAVADPARVGPYFAENEVTKLYAMAEVDLCKDLGAK